MSAPLFGLFMGGEENVQVVAFDRAAAIQDLHGLAVVVAGDDKLCAEGVLCWGGDEMAIVGGDGFSAGGNALGMAAAANFARAVSRHIHPDNMRVTDGCPSGVDQLDVVVRGGRIGTGHGGDGRGLAGGELRLRCRAGDCIGGHRSQDAQADDGADGDQRATGRALGASGRDERGQLDHDGLKYVSSGGFGAAFSQAAARQWSI